MNKVVIDASAMLALLNQEDGYTLVEQYIIGAIMSSVNFSEVITVLLELGVKEEEAETTVSGLLKEIVIFDKQQAILAASLRQMTKAYGLSLGDRACLALAQKEKIPVLTADKIWNKIDSPIEIILIR